MIETGLTPIEIFKLYSGNGTFMLMFVASLVYLWCFEKEKINKMVLVLSSVTLLVLFVFPLFSGFFMHKMDEETTYYRFLWTVPTAIISSYAIIHFLNRFKKWWLRLILMTIITACILIVGVFMYEGPMFYDWNNPYQIPDEVIDICDEIVIENREVGAVFPDEILYFPRMYNSYIVMPYGFETLQFGTGPNSDLHSEMTKETIDVKTLFEMCESRNIHYVILNRNKTLSGDPSEHNYEFVDSYGDYDLYRSTTLFFGQWEDYEEWLSEKNG